MSTVQIEVKKMLIRFAFAKVKKMVAYLLPIEATHSPLNLFEKPTLLGTSDGKTCKNGCGLQPVSSNIGIMWSLPTEISYLVYQKNF